MMEKEILCEGGDEGMNEYICWRKGNWRLASKGKLFGGNKGDFCQTQSKRDTLAAKQKVIKSN